MSLTLAAYRAILGKSRHSQGVPYFLLSSLVICYGGHFCGRVNSLTDPTSSAKIGSMTQRQHVRYGDFSYKGKTYTLGHLNDFDHKYYWSNSKTGQMSIFNVRVMFDDHCFTNGVSHQAIYDRATYISHTVDEIRIFDASRYQLSLGLPKIIKGLIDMQCYFGDQDNFFSVETSSGQNYNIYFVVSRDGRTLRLRIQSAYIRSQIDSLEKVRFGLILRNTRDGKHTKPKKW